MFYCDYRKALWYLNRSAVDIVSDCPPILRFNFNPGGLGWGKDSYYFAKKLNQCVVCGDAENLNRHHVVPHVFRRHMPEFVKEHNYHDILLLCLSCHEKYELEANKFKKFICKELGYDLKFGSNQVYMPDVGKAVNAARALCNFGKKIPESRYLFLLSVIKEYLKKDQITDDDINEVAGHYMWKISEGYKEYGKFVVENIDNIQIFVERWRRHFVETMNPKYLPELWSIEKLF